MGELFCEISANDLEGGMNKPVSAFPARNIIDQEIANCRDLHEIRFKNVEREIEKLIESVEKTEARNDKFYAEIRSAIHELTKTTEQLQSIGKGLYISMAVVAFVLLLMDKFIK